MGRIEISKRLNELSIGLVNPHRQEAQRFADFVIEEYKESLEEDEPRSLRDILTVFFEQAMNRAEIKYKAIKKATE